MIAVFETLFFLLLSFWVKLDGSLSPGGKLQMACLRVEGTWKRGSYSMEAKARVVNPSTAVITEAVGVGVVGGGEGECLQHETLALASKR